MIAGRSASVVRPLRKAVLSAVSTYALDTTWRILLTDLGVHPADALRRAGLADDLLQQQHVRLGSEDYYRLWRSIEAAVEDTSLAIRLCEAARAESFSPPLFAAMCSPNLFVAAQRIARYKALIAPIRLDVRCVCDRVDLTFTWLDAPFEPPPSLIATELLFCVQLGRIGTRTPLRPIEVTSSAEPLFTAEAEAYLGVKPRQGDTHRITFSNADAFQPFLTSNDTLWSVFEPQLRQRLGDLDETASTSTRVRAALLEGLPSGLVTIESIATKLALSKRTLQRRIEAEGTSFQELLRASREGLARHYLERTHLPIAEIAFLVGFDEPSSFYRAFRTWTGVTPRALRCQ